MGTPTPRFHLLSVATLGVSVATLGVSVASLRRAGSYERTWRQPA